MLRSQEVEMMPSGFVHPPLKPRLLATVVCINRMKDRGGGNRNIEVVACLSDTQQVVAFMSKSYNMQYKDYLIFPPTYHSCVCK